MKKNLLLLMLVTPVLLQAQQLADSTFNPVVNNPAYSAGKGPLVLIDEGHNNFHTRDGRYMPFTRVLEKDGYIVGKYPGDFMVNELSRCRILVISNAVNDINVRKWFLPTPSAFSVKEIDALAGWVNNGGSLFLIADHMPFGGAATDLAARFGFGFSNGYVVDTIRSTGTIYFNRFEGSLTENVITAGREKYEKVDSIVSFTGQAFMIPADATPILVFNNAGKNYVNLLPDTAGAFHSRTPMKNPDGLSQGAYKKYGKGRLVVFGEAAMFSAQTANGMRIGMNSDKAPYNIQLLLNIIHWLDGKFD